MKWAYSMVGALILGISSAFILFFFEEVTVSNEQDYYLLKELTEATMIDSIDIAYYRDTGEFKIVKEKFVELFTKRYINNAQINDYKIEFYDINEEPPKVTVRIKNQSGSYNIYTSMPGTSESAGVTQTTVVNENSAIINSNSCYKTRTMYSLPYSEVESGNSNYKFENTIEVKEVKGYEAISATYLNSFKEDQESKKEFISKYYENKILYNIPDSDNDILESNFESLDENKLSDGLADIAISSFSLGSNNSIHYNAVGKCSQPLSGLSLRNGSSINNICLSGIKYEIVYRNTEREECQDNSTTDTPTKKFEIVTGVDIGYATHPTRYDGSWNYSSYQNSTYLELYSYSPCQYDSKKQNCELTNIKKFEIAVFGSNIILKGGTSPVIKLSNLTLDEFNQLKNKSSSVDDIIDSQASDGEVSIDPTKQVLQFDQMKNIKAKGAMAKNFDINSKLDYTKDGEQVNIKYQYKGQCDCGTNGTYGFEYYNNSQKKWGCAIGFKYAIGWTYDYYE